MTNDGNNDSPKCVSPSVWDGKEGSTVGLKLFAWVLEWRFPNYNPNYIVSHDSGILVTHRYKSDLRKSGFLRPWNKPNIQRGKVEGQRVSPLKAQWLYVVKGGAGTRTLEAEIFVINYRTWYEKVAPNPELTPSDRFNGCIKMSRPSQCPRGAERAIPVKVDKSSKWGFFLSQIQLDKKAVKKLLTSQAKDLLVEMSFEKSKLFHAVLIPDPYQWTEDIHCHHYIPALKAWKSYTLGEGYTGKTRKKYQIRMAKVAIASGIAQAMGKCPDWDPQKFTQSTKGNLAKDIQKLPHREPPDKLSLGNELKDELGGWKAPFKYIRDNYWKWEYFKRISAETAVKNLWEWVNGSAHLLIDESAARSPTLLAKGPDGKEIPIGAPVWLASEHWGRIFSRQQDSKPGRLFLRAVCAKPRDDVTWVKGADKPGKFFPSRLFYSEKKKLMRYILRTPMALQLGAAAFPIFLADLGQERATLLLHEYYNTVGIWTTILSIQKTTSIMRQSPVMLIERKMKPIKNKMDILEGKFKAKDFLMFMEIESLKRPAPSEESVMEALEKKQPVKASIEADKKYILARESLEAQRVKSKARFIGRYSLMKEEYEGLLKRFRMWSSVGSVLESVNLLIGMSGLAEAISKKDKSYLIKNLAEITGALVDSFAVKVGRKTAGKLLGGFAGGGLSCYIDIRELENSKKVGDINTSIGHGIGAFGGGIGILAVAAEIGALFATEGTLLASACAIAGPIALIALLFGLAGAIITTLAKDNPYEIFARFCFLGEKYRDPEYGENVTKWSLGPFKSWWPKGKDELPALQKQLSVLNFLMSNFVVESDKFNDKIKLHVRPGLLDSSAEFRIEIYGTAIPDNYKGDLRLATVQSFKVNYNIWPKKKRSQVTFSNMGIETLPGACKVASDGTIWIDLPFHKFVKQAMAKLDLFPFGANQPAITHKHEIQYLGGATNYEVKKKVTYSAV